MSNARSSPSKASHLFWQVLLPWFDLSTVVRILMILKLPISLPCIARVLLFIISSCNRHLFHSTTSHFQVSAFFGSLNCSPNILSEYLQWNFFNHHFFFHCLPLTRDIICLMQFFQRDAGFQQDLYQIALFLAVLYFVVQFLRTTL